MTKKRRYAMLDTLLAAESKGLIDSEGIREEVDTFTFEGHDTTSSALTFTLLLLAHHPEAQKKILEELRGIKKDDENLNMTDLSQLKYLDRVIKESLRLYPPVPYLSRIISEDVVIGKKSKLCGKIFNFNFFSRRCNFPKRFVRPDTRFRFTQGS